LPRDRWTARAIFRASMPSSRSAPLIGLANPMK
jgi:hypothetical protein